MSENGINKKLEAEIKYLEELLGAIRERDSKKFLDLFNLRLVGLARNKIHGSPLEGVREPESLANEALNSFVVGLQNNKYQLQYNAKLWFLLLAIMRNKFLNSLRHIETEKRGGKAKTVSFEEITKKNNSEEDFPSFEPQDTNHDLKRTRDEMYEFLCGQTKDEEERIILQMTFEGYTVSEIADSLNVGRSRIKRIIDNFVVRCHNASGLQDFD